MLTREQLINAILTVNPTVGFKFLMKFDTIDLRRYFERLQLIEGPRGRDSIWTRPDDAPAFFSAAA